MTTRTQALAPVPRHGRAEGNPPAHGTHPNVLHAHAAGHSLRRALRDLAEVRDAETIPRPADRTGPTPRRAQAALARIAQAADDDRAARWETVAAGGRPDTPSPMPVRPALLDAQRTADVDVDTAFWITASATRAHPLLRHDPTWDVVGAGRLGYVLAALPGCDPGTAYAVAGLLRHADRAVRRAAGLGDPEAIPVPGNPACPSCSTRMLRIQTSSTRTGDWTVVCGAGCRCDGPHCACGMPTRARGARHIWDRIPDGYEAQERVAA